MLGAWGRGEIELSKKIMSGCNRAWPRRLGCWETLEPGLCSVGDGMSREPVPNPTDSIRYGWRVPILGAPDP